MASLASAERGGHAAFAVAILAAAALGWSALAWLSSNAVTPLCGLSAEALANLGGLVAMWSLMVVTMMLPVTLVRTSGRSMRDDAGYSLGYLAMALVPAWGAALIEWTLRGLSLTPNGVPPAGVQFGLVGLALLGLVRDAKGHRPITGAGTTAGASAGRAHLGASTAMVALQLAFGSMDLLLMAVLALWMLTVATIPRSGKWPPPTEDKGSRQRPSGWRVAGAIGRTMVSSGHLDDGLDQAGLVAGPFRQI